MERGMPRRTEEGWAREDSEGSISSQRDYWSSRGSGAPHSSFSQYLSYCPPQSFASRSTSAMPATVVVVEKAARQWLPGMCEQQCHHLDTTATSIQCTDVVRRSSLVVAGSSSSESSVFDRAMIIIRLHTAYGPAVCISRIYESGHHLTRLTPS